MAILDFSWLAYYMAIFGFLFVYVVVYAILSNTKLLGDNNYINSLTAFVFAIIFITFSPGVEYVGVVLPWFVILLICLFLFLIMIGFSQKDMSKFMKPWVTWVFIAILIIIFLISAIKVFNPILGPYLPGVSDTGGDPSLLLFKNFFYSEKVLGAIILLIIAAIASWILTKKK
ncbi:MAG: hypothetical protein WC781_02980 [Candidatus Pacearchaeota archaeon]|jgi:hypothetical protein